MDADASQSREPVATGDEVGDARRTIGWFWWRQGLAMPDFAEAAGGWAELPRKGRWTVVVLVVGVIMLLPIAGIAVALLD